MYLNWADYSGDSGVQDTPLLLSIRSQSLILAALQCVQSRYSWQELSDTEWDDVDGAIASAINEVMKISMPDFTPVGTIVAYAGTVASIPEKWQICDGHLLDVDDYPDLRDVLDTPFDDNTFLTVPDLRDRFIYGKGTSSNLGATGGAETVALAINELPAHTHGVLYASATGANTTRMAVGANSGTGTTPTTSVGSGAAHQNLPPYMRLYYIMKVLP
jgi:microcystin-dependent protein